MTSDHTAHPFPCNHLLEEIQLAMLPIVHQLPIVHSMLKWARSTLERRTDNCSFGWMLLMDPAWTKESRYDHLISLKKSVSELQIPLKATMHRIHELRLHRPVQHALVAFHDAYQKLPTIEPEIHRLTLGDNLLDNKDLLHTLLNYVEKVTEIQSKAATLKQVVIQEVVQHISQLYPKNRF